MKYLVFLCLCYSTLSMTYFGEYFQCSLFDQCKEEYQTCLSDSVCSFQMFTSPCIDPCGVDYEKFFQQMRTYGQNHNQSENIALFPEASCSFTTCQTNWINSLNNTVLKALKECEMQKCLQAYPSYTFIAHEYEELLTCNTQITACEASSTCNEIAKRIDICLEEKGFHVDPKTSPQEYFHEHVNTKTLDSGLLQCLAAETSQEPTYLAMVACIKPIWSK